jgi:hypothetical protein
VGGVKCCLSLSGSWHFKGSCHLDTIFCTARNHLPSDITLHIRRLKPIHSVPIIKTSHLMLYTEIITVFLRSIQNIIIQCGLNVKLLNVKPVSICYLLLRLMWLDTYLSSGNMFSMYHWNGLQSSWLFNSSCSCKLQRETFSAILCSAFLSRRLFNDVSHNMLW